MTNPSVFNIKDLSDHDLERLVEDGKAELAARDKRRKEDTIARIRAMASDAGLSVSINGARGRPGGKTKRQADAKTDRAVVPAGTQE